MSKQEVKESLDLCQNSELCNLCTTTRSHAHLGQIHRPNPSLPLGLFSQRLFFSPHPVQEVSAPQQWPKHLGKAAQMLVFGLLEGSGPSRSRALGSGKQKCERIHMATKSSWRTCSSNVPSANTEIASETDMMCSSRFFRFEKLKAIPDYYIGAHKDLGAKQRQTHQDGHTDTSPRSNAGLRLVGSSD